MTHLTGENYASEVGRADRPVLIDFFSPACAPCRALAPTFETLAAQYGDRYKFCKVDVDAQDDLTERFRIQGQDVSRAMQESGIPAGVYVTEAVSGSPAYLLHTVTYRYSVLFIILHKICRYILRLCYISLDYSVVILVYASLPYDPRQLLASHK